jgi:hypothetical protein
VIACLLANLTVESMVAMVQTREETTEQVARYGLLLLLLSLSLSLSRRSE